MKPEIIKTNDEVNFDERSAGGLVYKIENGKVYWLLIKTSTNNRTENIGRMTGKELKSVYKFPKGHLQKNEFLKQAALREVEEEGRVKAKVVIKLGSNNYIIWDKELRKKIVKKVTFFLMEYLEPSNLKYYDKELVLERDWFTFDEANQKLAYDSEKILLKKAKNQLEALIKQ